MRPRLVALSLAVSLAGCASSAPDPETPESPFVGRPVEYEHAGEGLTGWLVSDPSLPGPRPGVLVVHEWWGLGDHAKRKAGDLARLGYVALCADMFGTGKVTSDPKQAGEWAGRFRTPEGRALGRERIRAALDVLRVTPGVDPERIGAVGFCFGGTVVLELAWSGAPVKGVVSFHGNPTAPAPGEAGAVKAAVLVCHGGDDPFVSEEALSSFEKAARDGRLDWSLVKYGGAVHSFTNPNADGSFNPGAKYDARADRRSWEHMRSFFREIFGE